MTYGKAHKGSVRAARRVTLAVKRYAGFPDLLAREAESSSNTWARGVDLERAGEIADPFGIAWEMPI